MADNKIQLRVENELAVLLRERAAATGMTVSSYVRMIIAQYLGDDLKRAAVEQIVWALNARLQKRISAVGDAMRVELERILLESDDDA